MIGVIDMLSKPKWLSQRAPDQKSLNKMEKLLRELSLNTVCESANCPNMGRCFENKTATFMIMGEICTRGCKFCAVTGGSPNPLDSDEPKRVASASKELGLRHIVITSVTRDDLSDGGAAHFAETVREIRRDNNDTSIEILIPDLKGDWEALEIITKSKPDIINHNIETVPSLYELVRPKAIYERSVELLRMVKALDNTIYTKSGMMLGLGEQEDEVIHVMKDLHRIDCDILTLGQYLRPSNDHIPIHEYVEPNTFEEMKKTALNIGFRFVAAGPFVRSSYNAFEGIEHLKTNQNKPLL